MKHRLRPEGEQLSNEYADQVGEGVQGRSVEIGGGEAELLGPVGDPGAFADSVEAFNKAATKRSRNGTVTGD